MIRLLSIGIGRGHPFYLDGIAHALRDREGAPEFRYSNVFERSDSLALAGWKAMRGMYRQGGRNASGVRLYGGARALGSGLVGEWGARALCRSLRRWIDPADVCVVDHPILAMGLRGVSKLFYQHGELGVPPECIVRGEHRILVPTPAAAQAFRAGGMDASAVLVTGLCIEPDLLRDASQWTADRRRRHAGEGPLCVAVFSSGAEPEVHVARLVLGLHSLAQEGHRAQVFARRGGVLAGRIPALPGIETILYSGREELDIRTAERFPVFDAIFSPAHERSNWGVGLGLPFVIVGPDVGPFPPRNRVVLNQAGVSRAVDSDAAARNLGTDLSAWRRSGALQTMSRCGEGPPTDGFSNAARMLLDAGLRPG